MAGRAVHASPSPAPPASSAAPCARSSRSATSPSPSCASWRASARPDAGCPSRAPSSRCRQLGDDSFAGVDLAFFAAGGDVSREFARAAVAAGATVIDKSSAFRGDPDVPLVVPEVNADHLDAHNGLIATPNCSTIQMVVALKPIYDAAGIERVVVTTYQAVSGSGQGGIAALDAQARAVGRRRDRRAAVLSPPDRLQPAAAHRQLPALRLHQGGAEDGRRDGEDLRRRRSSR